MKKLFKLSAFAFIVSCMFTMTVSASYKDDAEAILMEVVEDLSVIDQSTANEYTEILDFYSSYLFEKRVVNTNWGMNIENFVAAEVEIDGSFTARIFLDVYNDDNEDWDTYEYEFQHTIKGTEVDGIAINSLNFPDDTFREYVVKGFDSDNDGGLSQPEINAVTTVYYDRDSISDLTGIEYFTNLETLNVLVNTTTTSVDLSANTKLKYLKLIGGAAYRAEALTIIDLSKNVELESVDISRTGITSLDLSNCKNISYLFLTDNNYLNSLNIVGLSKLKDIYLYDTRLTVLDLRGNESLEYMEHGYLDPTSGCTAIETWYLGDFDFNISFYERGVFCSGLVFYEESNDTWDSGISRYYYGDTAYAYDSDPSLPLPKASDYTSSSSGSSTSGDSSSDNITTDDTTSNEEANDTSDDTTAILECEEVFTEGVLQYDIGGIAGVSKLAVASDEVTLVFDEEALASITNTMQDAVNDDLYFADFSITAVEVDSTTLDKSVQELVGSSRPVFDFSVVATDALENDLEITEFGEGSVTISIAYELAKNESADGLCIYYIDGDSVEKIIIDSYDSENGIITFTTNHFSIYAVGYEEKIENDDTDIATDDKDDPDIDDEDADDEDADDAEDEDVDDEDTDDKDEDADDETTNVMLYAMLVVILAAVVGGAIFVVKKRKTEEEITEEETTEEETTVEETTVEETAVEETTEEETTV